MASNIFWQRYADGSSGLMRRSIKQGRTALPEGMKKIRTNITISKESKEIITEKAKKLGMSFSAYVELSGVLYTPELLKS